MIQPGRKYSATYSYRYGFNGKENDSEVKGEGNQQDYGMRIYDPRLGRFLSVDPLMPKYPWYTPYQFAGNMPIWAIDIDGLEPDQIPNKSESSLSPVPQTRPTYPRAGPGKVVEMKPSSSKFKKNRVKEFINWIRENLRKFRPIPFPGAPVPIPIPFPEKRPNPNPNEKDKNTPKKDDNPDSPPTLVPEESPVGLPTTDQRPLNDPNAKPNPQSKPREEDDDPEDMLLYRGGRFTDLTFTPRPDKDIDPLNPHKGLSTFTNPQAAARDGGPVQILSAKKIKAAGFRLNIDGTHVSILPGYDPFNIELNKWANTRPLLQQGRLGQPGAHPLTLRLEATRVGEISVPKPRKP